LRRKVFGLAMALAAAVAASGAALAAVPQFHDGPAVARAMERRYNGAAYKRKLAASNPGTRLTTRVLCAYDDYGTAISGEAYCTGRIRVQRAGPEGRPADGRWVVARATWLLEPRTARRAMLRWWVSGPGFWGTDSEVVRPGEYGLRRF
jgi:hypothetical protein